MQWSVRGGSSATRAQRKEQRERWARQPVLRGKPLAPAVPAPPKGPDLSNNNGHNHD